MFIVVFLMVVTVVCVARPYESLGASAAYFHPVPRESRNIADQRCRYAAVLIVIITLGNNSN